MRVPNPDDDVCRKTRQAKEEKKSKMGASKGAHSLEVYRDLLSENG